MFNTRGFILAALLFCACSTAFSQEKNADLYQLPFHGVSQTMKKLIAKQKDTANSFVAFLITPRFFVRGEGMMKALGNILAKRKNVTTVGIVNSPKYYAGLEYIRSMNYSFPCILDTGSVYFKDLNLAPMPVYVTRWDKNGRLLFAQCLVGQTINNAYADKILTEIDTVAGYTPPQKKEIHNQFISAEWKELHPQIATRLEEGENAPLGTLNAPNLGVESPYMALYDSGILGVRIFDKQTGKHLYEVALDYKTRRMFSTDLNDAEFAEVERSKIAPTMIFNPFFIAPDTLLLYASLPEIKQTYVGKDTTQSIWNKHVLITGYCGESGYKVLNVAPVEKSQGAIFSASFLPYIAYNSATQELALNVSKGYPARGFSKKDAEGEHDPRKEEFYQNAPLFRSVNIRNGRLGQYYGKLDDINKKWASGYALGESAIAYSPSHGFLTLENTYTKPMLRYNGGEIVVKTYCSDSILAWKPSYELPVTTDLEEIQRKLGASVYRISAGKTSVFVHWIIASGRTQNARGSERVQRSVNVVQEYNFATKTLQGEYYIPVQLSSGEMLADVVIDAEKRQVVGIYQGGTTSLITHAQIP